MAKAPRQHPLPHYHAQAGGRFYGVRHALARSDRSYPRVVQSLAGTWLLILDGWGFALSGRDATTCSKILDHRYVRRGTLLASQVPVEHRHHVVGDPTFGDAILDHLTQQRPRDHPQGRFPEKALELDEDL